MACQCDLEIHIKRWQKKKVLLIRPRVSEQHLDTTAQRIRGVIHALARSEADRTRPKPEDQTVPAFSGFQAKLSTEPNPPSKTILYDVTRKLARVIDDKKMPFSIIVCNQPVYA